MNVVRELRNTITHLEAEMAKKQQQFTHKKQQYEDIISSLQQENNRLKSLLQEESLFSNKGLVSKEQSLKHIPYNHSQDHQNPNLNDPNPYKPNHFDHNITQNQKIWISSQQYSSLINQNIFLKNEISEISATYQQQIDQITYYFDKIKHQNQRLLPNKAHYNGRIKYIEKTLTSYMKDSENQKQKLKNKLIQYSNLLQEFQIVLHEKQQKIDELRQKILEHQQQIKLLNRLQILIQPV